MRLNRVVLITIIAMLTLNAVSIAKAKEAAVSTAKAEQAKEKAQSDKPAPVIHIENPVHDFGKIGPEVYLPCIFKFKNIGSDTLKIEEIKSTCRCVTSKLDKTDYAPGESGTVKVTFHSPSKAGKTNQTLYIFNNDPKNSQAPMTITALVELDVEVTPDKFDLSLKKGNAGIGPITITGKKDIEFAIKSFTSPKNAITAKIDPKAKAKKFVIEPKVDIKKLMTSLNGTITITLDHPQTKRLKVPYTTKPLFEVNRPRIIIQQAKPGQKIIKTVLIKSNYKDKVEIDSITTMKKSIKALKRKRLDDNRIQVEIEITVPPKKKGAKLSYFTDTLTIKLKGGQTLPIRCSGWYALNKKKK